MPQINFSHKEIVELLVRKAQLTEGIWGLQIRFAMRATNITEPNGDLVPSAVCAVVEIGLQTFDTLNNISVDAAELVKSDTAKAKKKH